MTGAPRRLLDDPMVDSELRDWLGSQESIAPLPPSTRRKVSSQVHASIAAGASIVGLIPDSNGVDSLASNGVDSLASNGVDSLASNGADSLASNGADSLVGNPSNFVPTQGAVGSGTASSGSTLAASAPGNFALFAGAKTLVVTLIVGAAIVGVWLGAPGSSPNVGTSAVPASSLTIGAGLRTAPAPDLTPSPLEPAEALPEAPSGLAVEASEAKKRADGLGGTLAGTAPGGFPGTGRSSAGARMAPAGKGVVRSAQTAQATARGSDALREEVRLLRAARKALPSNPARARGFLRDYASRFANGTLKVEYLTLVSRLRAAPTSTVPTSTAPTSTAPTSTAHSELHRAPGSERRDAAGEGQRNEPRGSRDSTRAESRAIDPRSSKGSKEK